MLNISPDQIFRVCMRAAAKQAANFLAVIRPFSYYYSLRQLRPRIWLSWPVGIEGETPLLVRTLAHCRCQPPPRSTPTPSRSWCWSPPRTHWACRAVRPHGGSNCGLAHFPGRHCRCSAHPNNNKKTEKIKKKKYTNKTEKPFSFLGYMWWLTNHSAYSWNIKCQKCTGISLNGFIFKKINEN